VTIGHRGGVGDMNMRSRPRKGFTLVELLVVVAILGALMALLLPAVQAVRESSRRAACGNNMRQIGLAVLHAHDHARRFPAGWTGGAADDQPGWGWAVQLLPQLEEQQAYDAIDFRRPVYDPVNPEVNAAVRSRKIPIFLCPSDRLGPTEVAGVFGIGALAGADHDDEHHAEHDDHEADHPVDDRDGSIVCEVGKSNYVGSFGAAVHIDDAPAAGDGMFFRNSRISTVQVPDGLSRTIFLGERNSRQGCSTWVGVVAGAAAARERVVGVADHVPNSVGHFEDYSSEHGNGATFVFGDCGTRFLNSDIDLAVFKALCTRGGNEAVSPP